MGRRGYDSLCFHFLSGIVSIIHRWNGRYKGGRMLLHTDEGPSCVAGVRN